MKATILEKDIQKTILDWLRLQRQCFVWRQNSAGTYRPYKGENHFYRNQDVDGVADIIGVWQGHPLAIEVKKPGGKPTENQLQFLTDFAGAGGIAMVVFDLSQVQEVFAQIKEAEEKVKMGTFSRFVNYTLRSKS